jgi:hypothetical protein
MVDSVVHSVLIQLPSACSGLDQPTTVSSSVLAYCLYALQNLPTLITTVAPAQSVIDTYAPFVAEQVDQAGAPVPGVVRSNVGPSWYGRAYLLSTGNPLDVLTAIRMVNLATGTRVNPKYTNHTPQASGSTNWAGYIIDETNTGKNALDAETCFNDVGPTNPNANHVSGWAGIGGVNFSKNLLQAGVNFLTQTMWWETVPGNPENDLVFGGSSGISPGDAICAGVRWDNYRWFWFVNDDTSGNGSSSEINFTPDKSTGEWIVERGNENSSDSSISPIPTIFFQQAQWANEDGVDRTIKSDAASHTWESVINNTSPALWPSDVSSDGYSFSVGY